jgi:hypothetical protein
VLLGGFQRSSSHSYQGKLYKYIKHLDLSSPRTRSSDRYLINRNFRFAHARARSPHPYGSKISKVTHRCREVFPSIRPTIKTTHQNEFHAVRADRQIDRSPSEKTFHSFHEHQLQPGPTTELFAYGYVRIKSFDRSLAPQNEIKPNMQRLVLEHFRYCADAKLQPVMYAACAKPNTPTNHHSSPIVCFDEWPPERKNYSSFFIISGLLSSVESLITSFLSTGD